MNNSLIVIAGPTAIGKTNVSIQLAKKLKCEILSADSRQFYKEMNIGTAVPSVDELNEITHHFIQHKSIHDTYTVGDFEKDAIQKLNTLFTQQKYAILVGGSGLYLDAVTNGLDHFPEVNHDLREKLISTYKNSGIESLQKQLKRVDPTYYNKVDLQNSQRILRALEVCLSSGKPYSSFLSAPRKKRPFKVLKIGITADRPIIYDRIEKRVDIMIAQGLVDEAKKLYDYRALNALNTVGYKELFNYFDGVWDLEFAISEIKKNTRRFAKRQLTWFRKDDQIMWFDYEDDCIQILNYIHKKTL
ncbi:tRNA (adenosine(37)-N6)-dimethylallyltransferase MiaA [Aquimarina sp. U1-2]|uniref:tRNA (adenosine(37)-N6)-dimethylallyltransferase MiaA n=1 Tax=Aquimarina sp. U1-2 TaxID=2823141 RepID=UPI001AED0CFF|nr:tRNA (adenosine(37)-N6)-dimethylallyltransferase MiaA [Aquimarina sp. U1-2]MBP2833896.1 tRNA (adenosine(37)-N6)-dimethylallyltransferase MiaA [Aquimarina sp. U1-2]